LFNEARAAARKISNDPGPLLWLTNFIQQRDH
jgi:hypothetical protein